MNAVTKNATLPAKQYALRDPLPEAWMDRIFSRLHAMFGSRFASMWAGVNPNDVKAVWAEELAGFRDMPHCIKEAIDSFLEADWPPDLPQFLKACRESARRHTPASLALVEKISEEELAERRQLIHGLAAQFKRGAA